MADKLIQLMSEDGVDRLYPVVMSSGFTGIDTSNVISSYTSNFTYTASGNCWLLGYLWIKDGYPTRTVTLNGNAISYQAGVDGSTATFCIPLKSGDVIAVTGQGGGNFALKIYGTK